MISLKLPHGPGQNFSRLEDIPMTQTIIDRIFYGSNHQNITLYASYQMQMR